MLFAFFAVCENSANSWENKLPERWRMSRIINSWRCSSWRRCNGAGEQVGDGGEERDVLRGRSGAAPCVQTPRIP